jgi:uncharacterized protein YecE (DUF72 family)
MASLYIGTSAFSAAGWEGTFYPAGTKSADFLGYYAERFNSVEVDSTFYRTPAKTTVQGWRNKTPNGFVFTAKVPQMITHDKILADCNAEFKEFVDAMDCLGDKLGPLLLQFGHFSRSIFPSVDEFLMRLVPFLKKLPSGHKFAVEIRNKAWLTPRFAEALRERGVALAMIDQSWMPGPPQWFDKFDPVTADFSYVRWLGDRKGIEQQTKIWDKLIVDRRVELSDWAQLLGKVHQRKVDIYAYANNHYAGFGPATVEMFIELWRQQGYNTGSLSRPARQGHLFQ